MNPAAVFVSGYCLRSSGRMPGGKFRTDEKQITDCVVVFPVEKSPAFRVTYLENWEKDRNIGTFSRVCPMDLNLRGVYNAL